MNETKRNTVKGKSLFIYTLYSIKGWAAGMAASL